MKPPNDASESKKTRLLYRRALENLIDAKIRFLVGGAFALEHYTGVKRDTKDLDIFVLPSDHPNGLKVLEDIGFETALPFPHWLGKAIDGENHIDIIFSSGNAIGRVDEKWFAFAHEGEFLDFQVEFAPPEEMIWSKAFIMERERFDGADILHLMLFCADKMDWARLLKRFEDHWRVLYSYLILFGFVYPSERGRIPKWLMEELARNLSNENSTEPQNTRICRGTLLSRLQYRIDIEEWGFLDARKPPMGNMTAHEIELWSKL